ncbi:MAG: prolipoprotein diacylglyceryl transferase [Bacteroidetes bacterium]|nr:MAG: prolipoprotein diacylglyceryl transferase [Bacteroidota bacterium]
MHPILFELFGIKIYAYGLLIGLGIALGVGYITHKANKELGISADLINNLAVYLVIAAVLGGKFLLFFENPGKYLNKPSLLVSGSGFVFYGSLLFCFGVLYWFIRKYKIAYKPFLDLIAIITCIIHAFGRLGCFMAGCCYGKPLDHFPAVTYTNPLSSAPLHCGLHPTQLYESGAIVLVLIVLLLVKQKRAFQGQLFALYLLLYPIVRFVIEYFRGDVERGLLFNGNISHSQLISMAIFGVGIYTYIRWRNEHKASN